MGAFRQSFMSANPTVMEPMMSVEVQVPQEFQGNVVGGLNRRGGFIRDSQTSDNYTTIESTVSLANMFGYSTDLRSSTQGKGEFSMEYEQHQAVTSTTLEELKAAYQKERQEKMKKK